MKNMRLLAAGLGCAVAGAVHAQVHEVTFELAQGDPDGTAAVDTCVAASEHAVIVGSNQRLQIVDPANGNVLDEVVTRTSSGPSSFPADYLFELVDSASYFRDPRVEYSLIHDRFFITIMEYTFGTDGSRFHVAVSLDDSPSTFNIHDGQSGDWYVYTGESASAGHGDAFQLNSTAIEPADLRFAGIPDHPVINIKEDHLWMVSVDVCPDFGPWEPLCAADINRGAVVSIPLEHGTSQSLLNGQRPSEAVFGIVQLQDLGADSDNTLLHYAVQEPFEQFTGGQLFINVAMPVDTVTPTYYDAVRLGGSYWDSGVLRYRWEDIGISTQSDRYFSGGVQGATTPSSWELSNRRSKFDSGALFKVNNEWRLLAGHHVVASDSTPAPTAFTEFRWYLIDPDLENFPGTSWSPSIVQVQGSDVIGRAPTSSITGADTYQGAIAINAYDDAYITFTRSGTHSPAGWPSLVRARLTTNYAGIQYEVTSVFEQGPKAWLPSAYNGTLGMDYVDMQAIGCEFWAVGTLVADPGEHEAPVEHGERAIWLSEFHACNSNAEMNGDGVVDEADLALYLDHYAKQTPQADMDGDTAVDAIDYLAYTDEYEKR